MNHKKFKGKLTGRVMACLLASFALGGVASAATIVSACSPLSGPTELSDNINCPTFDNTLGTLTNIQIDFTGSTDGTISLHNTSLDPQTITVNESSDFNLGALSGFLNGLLFTTSLTTGPQVVPAGGTAVVPVSSLNGTGTVSDSTAATFGAYTGDGIVTFAVPITTLTGFSTIGGGGNVQVTLATNALINAQVTYTFGDQTSDTPEPATLGLIGSGLVGVGLFSFRKRRKQA